MNNKDMNFFEFMDYLKVFSGNLELLLNRYAKFKDIPNSNVVEYFTYFDIIIVQLRAMCIENERYENNYTVQVLMRKVRQDNLADRLDRYLQNELTYKITIKEAIKFIADKFVCHYDNTDIGDRSKEHICRANFSNTYNKFNLESIVKEIIEIVGEGLKLENSK